MAEYIESICHSCFHSYVCERFNEHRDSHNEKCHFYSDHFAPAADVVAVVRCRDCRNSMLWRKPTDTVIGECLIRKMHSEDEVFCQVGADDFCSYGERRGEDVLDK
jgi:hypothetical protein